MEDSRGRTASVAVKPDQEDLDFNELRHQISDYKDNILSTLIADNESK
jgi:hypothetical protein